MKSSTPRGGCTATLAAGEQLPSNAPAPAITPPSSERPAQQGRYGAEISRKNPGCLVFLIDQSGSMEEPIAGGAGQSKKQVVADAVNRLLYNTVLLCAKEDGVQPYFDIGVWTYGGNQDVKPAFGYLLSIKDIAERPKRTETRRKRVPDGAGGVYEEELQLPVWIEPVADGVTPMNAAFQMVVGPLKDWMARHLDSFPPIVINLTDGAYSSGSPAATAWELMSLGTHDGNVLIFNCHISALAGMTVSFPGDAQAARLQGLARELYDFSSSLPESMRGLARAKGYGLSPGARGYAFNADQVTLIDFLDIGTRTVPERTE